MLSLLDPRLWLAGLAIVLASSGASYLRGRSDGSQICEAAHAKAAVLANNESHKMEALRQSRVDEAARVAANREARLRDSAASARRDAGGLRNDLSAARDYAAKSRAAAERIANVATGLLERCTNSYLGVAEAAQRADSEARELRAAWPR